MINRFMGIWSRSEPGLVEFACENEQFGVSCSWEVECHFEFEGETQRYRERDS